MNIWGTCNTCNKGRVGQALFVETSWHVSAWINTTIPVAMVLMNSATSLFRAWHVDSWTCHYAGLLGAIPSFSPAAQGCPMISRRHCMTRSVFRVRTKGLPTHARNIHCTCPRPENQNSKCEKNGFRPAPRQSRPSKHGFNLRFRLLHGGMRLPSHDHVPRADSLGSSCWVDWLLVSPNQGRLSALGHTCRAPNGLPPVHQD